MSSPIANPKKGFTRSFLIALHQRLSHRSRVSVLSQSLSRVVESLPAASGKLSCLDIGCGDMQIAEHIGLLNPKTDWTCIDVYALPEDLGREQRWAKYRQFDGLHIPFGERSFDVALLCDVLHHDYRHAGDLLREAGRVARFIVVKDHFAHSRYARLMLLVMD
ncbi:MAG TPA: methyltransferase domain-containing protein, partial [Dissulfurispiraceae bacterium]|nr:methyltransferase domain-containing protein [Dissulfurispiraceae bacterium]